MARSVANRAALAADALDSYLRGRPAAVPAGHPAVATAAAPPQADGPEGPSSARDTPAALAPAAGPPLRLPHPDWLYHRLTVAGPPSELARFQAAASGAGTIPWHLDLDLLEEDWFHLLADPARRTLSLAGARILAGQLRDAVQRRQAVALARVGRSRACPLDLHALIPVPAGILRLGPEHPAAFAWLWQHWGTTEALRHVTLLPAGPAADGGILRLSFWSADWTPWQAVRRIRSEWPGLRLSVQPVTDAS